MNWLNFMTGFTLGFGLGAIGMFILLAYLEVRHEKKRMGDYRDIRLKLKQGGKK